MKQTHIGIYSAIIFGLALFIYGQPAWATTAVLDTDLTTFTGEANNDSAGYTLAGIGDADGDGYDDFAISAVNNADAGFASGAVYIIYGRTSQITGVRHLDNRPEFTGEAASDSLGYTLAGAGDVNGDGYDDFIAGTVTNGDGGSNAGAVYLVYGSSTRQSGTQSISSVVEFTGEAAGDSLGYSLAGAGDVNGDGYADMLFGAYTNDDGGSNAGSIYLLYGSNKTFTGTQTLTAEAEFVGEVSGDRLGSSVALADLNGDGYDDIVLGANRNDDAGSDAGAVYVVYGSSALYTGTTVLTSVMQFTGLTSAKLGTTVSSAGDFNHDGYDDLALGAPNYGSTGTVYLVYGQSSPYVGVQSITLYPTLIGNSSNVLLGQSLAAVGDVNNDSYDDLLVGDPSYDSASGASYLMLGEAAPLTGDHDINDYTIFVGSAQSDQAGHVSGAGDVNNDGYDDLLIGAPHNAPDAAEVYTGAVYLAYLYVDADHDGIAGSAGVLADTDCDDSVAGISANQTYYRDQDGDGLGNSADTTAVCSHSAPSGYVTNSTDSNDGDYDNDGVITANDCDDHDSTHSATYTYYRDLDADGLGDPHTTVSSCSSTAPTGYVTDYTDTDDADTAEAVPITDVSHDGSSLIIDNEDGSSTTLDPFNGSDQYRYVVTDDSAVVATNGKLVRVFVNGARISQKKINARSLRRKYITLKVRDLYSSVDYSDVMVLLAKRHTGKVNHLRLTSSHTLTKFHHQQVAITQRTHRRLRVRPATHRFISRFGSGANKTHSVWSVTASGALQAVE